MRAEASSFTAGGVRASGVGGVVVGDVRVLGVEEKEALYRACVPWLEGAHGRRLGAMEAARGRRLVVGGKGGSGDD